MYIFSGVISVYFEANVSSAHHQGFNASFWVRRCTEGGSEEDLDGSSECQGLARCRDGICQCPSGYGGPLCDWPMCPGDCGNHLGRGICNKVTLNVDKLLVTYRFLLFCDRFLFFYLVNICTITLIK